ncbi:LacI family DNA-binding transcriptional regulator [Mesobacterium pallidum]|uniref:LacI family DNA-binding transcriptional regulator n=1 Tax=Mesobacterium pallidum TaxID=2872037 RepID=UPI001EE3549C
MQSIADELGLSKFAVSRALSGKSGVSDKTRRLVEEAAARQGYRPRNAARSESHVVRLIFPNAAVANRELWIDMRHGIEMQAMREGYEIDLVHTRDPARVAEMADTSLGLIIAGTADRAVLEAAQATGLPVVTCAHEVPPLIAIDQVTATDEETGVYVGEYLEKLGHRDIVYVEGQAGFPGRTRRLNGMRHAVSDDVRVSLMTFSEDYAGSEFLPEMERILATGARPTAFFCGSDGVAVTCLSELLRLGLRVPEDVSVVGHADYPLATQVSPNLTTIRMPNREVGMQAVQMIRFRQAPAAPPAHGLPMRIHLVASLVERDSSGPAGSPDWQALRATAERPAE